MNDSLELPGADRAALLSALGWWVEAGVDSLLEQQPQDWFASAQPPIAAGLPAEDRQPGRALRPQAIAAGTRAFSGAATLAELQAEVEAFSGCPLRTPGRATVFADGNPAADLMLIGDVPRIEDERTGIPFAGPPGQLLDRMLAAIGRDRSSAYLTNVCFWRPPGDRTPTAEEIETTSHFVHRHITLVRPKAIVAVGAVAARALTGDPAGIMRVRGRWQTVPLGGADYPLLPIFHPLYLLQQPAAKRLAWADLLSLKARLDAD